VSWTSCACIEGLRLAQQQQERTRYSMETVGGFRPVFSWQCTSQEPPVEYQGHQDVQQVQPPGQQQQEQQPWRPSVWH